MINVGFVGHQRHITIKLMNRILIELVAVLWDQSISTNNLYYKQVIKLIELVYFLNVYAV